MISLSDDYDIFHNIGTAKFKNGRVIYASPSTYLHRFNFTVGGWTID